MAACQENAELLLSMREDSGASSAGEGGAPGAAVADGQARLRPEGSASGQCRRGSLSTSLLAGVAFIALGLCLVKWSHDRRVASGGPRRSGPRASRGLVDFPRTLDRDAAVSLYDAAERGAAAERRPPLPQDDDKVLGALSATADWMGSAFGGVQSSLSNSGLFWDGGGVQDEDHFSDGFGELSASDDDGGLAMGHRIDDLLPAAGDFAPTPSQFAPTPSQSLPASSVQGPQPLEPVEPAEPLGGPSAGESAELAGPAGADASDSQASGNTTTTNATIALTTTTSIVLTETLTATSGTKSTATWYKVVFSGPVNVRAWPNIEAPIHKIIWKCDRFHGVEDVSGWVTVLGDNSEIDGYVKESFADQKLVMQSSGDRSLAVVGVKSAADTLEASCSRCSAEKPCAGMQWQVVHAGAVAVYKEMDTESDIVAYKWKCDLVHGVRLEKWVMLVQGDEPDVKVEGYMAMLDAEEEENAVEVTAVASEQLECRTCAEGEEDCGSSGCCRAPGSQCYKHADGTHGCQYTCNPNEDGSGCEEVGDRSWPVGMPDFPSMFCFSLMRPDSYEEPLMKAQLAKGAGIFACDDFTVLAPSDVHMGTSPTGERVKTLFSEPAPVGISKDGTAANTQIFFNAWDAIHNDGKYKKFAWTVKMDPDAVLIPDRVKAKVLERGLDGRNDRVYFANCNRFPDNEDFPMMYGAMEVLSFATADLYMSEGYKCMDLPYQLWGEDLYLANCLRTVLGVERIFDSTMVGDSRCMGGACWDHAFAAFHEFKSEESWFECYDQTHGSF